VFVGIGAMPLIPPIPGVDGKNVMIAADIYGHEQKIGQKVVIVGGGLVGMETGVYLADMGKEVTVVEMTGDFAADASQPHRIALARQAREKFKALMLNAACKKITDNGIIAIADGKELFLQADTVLVAVGMKAKTAEAYALDSDADTFAVIGDCRKVGKIQTANADAFFAAMDL
jgi:pyruvate/2-oxoglutarate dehydrogenase complex dihydrolipoamide dehydrogenase (E3) component